MANRVYTAHLTPDLLDRHLLSLSGTSVRSIGRPEGVATTECPGLKISWPQTDHGRIKKVITRGGTRRRYCVPCFRGGDREAHCEAEEEADAAILADACAGVLFQEQPAMLEFEWRGEMHTHFPDLLVVDGHRREFVECKRDAEGKDFLIRKRAERLKELLPQVGFGYRILTTSTIHRLAYFENAVRMRRAAKAILYEPSWVDSLDTVWSKASPNEVGVSAVAREVLSRIAAEEREDALFSLLFHGHLIADFSEPVTLESAVFHKASCTEGCAWIWKIWSKQC